MDQEQQDLREPEDTSRREIPPTRTRKQVLLWTGGILVALAFLSIVICGYLFGWKWTGVPKQTFWDWLSLLIVPAVLAVGGFLFTRSENQRTLQSSKQQREVDREVAKEQAETDREIADQCRQDDTLQAYLDQIGQLLLDKDRPLRQSKEGDEVQTLARARTRTVLARLDGPRKAPVVQFLYESDLIAADQHQPVLDLSGADLSGADLSETKLREAKLREADLSNANLSNADLIEADLSNANLSDAGLYSANLIKAMLYSANLSNAVLIGSNLRGADLSNADLSNANLSNGDYPADLSNANLSGADLSEAQGWTEEQLSKAASLEDATMPDGQTLRGYRMPNGPTFEDWLKDQKAREDE